MASTLSHSVQADAGRQDGPASPELDADAWRHDREQVDGEADRREQLPPPPRSGRTTPRSARHHQPDDGQSDPGEHEQAGHHHAIGERAGLRSSFAEATPMARSTNASAASARCVSAPARPCRDRCRTGDAAISNPGARRRRSRVSGQPNCRARSPRLVSTRPSTWSLSRSQRSVVAERMQRNDLRLSRRHPSRLVQDVVAAQAPATTATDRAVNYYRACELSE